MNIEKIKENHFEQLKLICEENNVNVNNIISLLDSAKTKKLYRRNNYHQQKISDIIQKAVK